MTEDLRNNERIGELADSGELCIRENVELRTLTGFRTGGNAKLALYPSTPAACAAIMKLCGREIAVLGCGSNVLARDEDVEVPVLVTARLNRLSWDGEIAEAGAGVPLSKLAVSARDRGLAGAEFLYGIPGSVGGACAMNAGAYGHELSEIAVSFEVCDTEGNVYAVDAADADLSYRRSRFSDSGELVIGARFRLTPDDREQIGARMEDLMHRRKDKQPLEYPSAGSYFKRPEGHFAGKLIEDCGLKGRSVGGARVSEKHAGFIINSGGATGSDVEALEELVRAKVLAETGVTLEREVKKLGAGGFVK